MELVCDTLILSCPSLLANIPLGYDFPISLIFQYDYWLDTFDNIHAGHFPNELLVGVREAIPSTLEFVLSMTKRSPEERPSASAICGKVQHMITQYEENLAHGNNCTILCNLEPRAHSKYNVAARVMLAISSLSSAAAGGTWTY